MEGAEFVELDVRQLVNRLAHRIHDLEPVASHGRRLQGLVTLVANVDLVLDGIARTVDALCRSAPGVQVPVLRPASRAHEGIGADHEILGERHECQLAVFLDPDEQVRLVPILPVGHALHLRIQDLRAA